MSGMATEVPPKPGKTMGDVVFWGRHWEWRSQTRPDSTRSDCKERRSCIAADARKEGSVGQVAYGVVAKALLPCGFGVSTLTEGG